MRSKSFLIFALGVLLLIGTTAVAQQVSSGTVEGRVVDENQDPVPGALITITGEQGKKSTTTNNDGEYRFPFVASGTYEVRAELSGYSTIVVPDVDVVINKRTILPITLPLGQVETVTVTSERPLVDTKTTSVGENFRVDEFIEALPVGRNFTAAIGLAPGAVASGGVYGPGASNYSIGGSSGLENSYLIDGVNVTDSGYGGVGTFTNVFGSLGTGVTTDFLEEVQVKTGGFEAEWGQALGGVVNSVVKSGGNQFTGALKLFAQPGSLEGGRKLVELPAGASGFLRPTEYEYYDVGLHMGGPIIKDKFFWFAAYNPVRTTETRQAQNLRNPLGGIGDYPDTKLYPSYPGTKDVDRDSDNYAAKLSWYMTPNHRLELTAFGDPSDGVGRDGTTAASLALPTKGADGIIGTADDGCTGTGVCYTPEGWDANGFQSNIDWGADQQALKWEGSFGANNFITAQVSHKKNEFTETPVVDNYLYRDRRLLFEWLFGGTNLPFGGNLNSGGQGFIGPNTDETYEYSLKMTTILGNHELRYGGAYLDVEYMQPSVYSGDQFTFDFPVNDGGDFVELTTASGARVDVRGSFWDCPDCGYGGGVPYYRVIRARLDDSTDPTKSKETSLFIQDTWSITPRWTLKLGLRYSKQELEGSGAFTIPFSSDPSTDTGFSDEPTSFTPSSYTFPSEIAPRIGVSWDVMGDGRSKLYANYGRYFERVPSDLAVRQFSNEVGFSSLQFADPALSILCSSANNQAGECSSDSPRFQGLSQGEIADNTKLPYVDEFLVGYQHQLRPNLSVEIRGIYRDQGRVLEDVQYTSVEETQNFYYGGYGYGDPFPGFGSNPFTNYIMANPGDNTPNDVAFPFTKPKREYRAVELIFNKRFSNNWLMYAHYRYSKLYGNYEGLFRNDNGQSDPNITSLFDFPESPIMRGQYNSGPLNTDRPNVLKMYGTYFFDNGLEIGGAFNWSSGTPRTSLLAHPNYQNSGELPGKIPLYYVPGDSSGDGTNDSWVAQPGTGWFLADYTDAPRGALGRNPDLATVDFHLAYKLNVKRSTLTFGVDVFNIFNSQEVSEMVDTVEFIATVPDPNFNSILAYQGPRQIRLLAKWNW